MRRRAFRQLKLPTRAHSCRGASGHGRVRGVLTLTDGFHTRGYPEPDRDGTAELAVAKRLIARSLRYTEPGADY